MVFVRFAASFGLVLLCISSGTHAQDAREILKKSGIRGGLVVHVGCGNGEVTAALCADDSYVVHGLDTDPSNVAQAREHIRGLDLYGKVSVDSFDGVQLPYVDNLVNLLVRDARCEIQDEEIMRVLAPGGVAIFLQPSADSLQILKKPWPNEIDDWTHYLHGPDNNAVAEDRVVGPPRHMQWLAGPKWTRHHHADKGTYPTIRAVVASDGRLYYMVDETKSSNMTVPSQWFLAARDAFSGVLLWKKPLQATIFERRLEQVWRTLVADGDRVYAPFGTDQPLVALDGATGARIRTYHGTENLQEFIKDKNRLFVVTAQNGIVALQADTGRRLWQWAPIVGDALVPVTLAASDGKIFLKTDKNVYCLSADEGETLWCVDLEESEKKIRLKWPRERLIVKDGVVLCSYGGKDPKVLDRDKFEYLGSHPRVHDYDGKLAALSVEDGSMLWHATYLPGLESMPGEIYVTDGLVWLGPAFDKPRDLQTGEIKQNRPVIDRLWTTGHHYRCYPGKATSKYILTAKRGIEMIDLTGETHSRNNWVRATCRVGVTPCNGLLYAPPHSCGCYMEAKLYGFWALAAAQESKSRMVEESKSDWETRLERGPAFGQALDSGHSTLDSSDWLTFRHDAVRSGGTEAAVPADLGQRWKADIGGRLSAVTVGYGKVLVAQVDAHTVHALDAARGEALWRFTAGGRVDSPPTLYGGMALFGASDGYVYCLRASDGQLAWRFQAAPQGISAVAFEQVESLWPVRGSVFVQDAIAYVAAGRSSYLDGGIVLYGLDLATGEVRCTNRLISDHTGALDPPPDEERAKMDTQIRQNYTDYKTFLAPDRSDAFSMRGALTDIMAADGNSIFMRNLRFDGQLVQQEEKRPHLFSTSSLLDDTEHHRSYWVFGTGDFSRTPVSYPWIATKDLAVPYGLMLTFDDKTVWGVHRGGGKGKKPNYSICAMPRPDPTASESALPDFATRTGDKRTSELWTSELPLRPRAMVRANDYLFIGGSPDPLAPKQTAAADIAAFEGKTSGLLRIVSCGDGEAITQMKLASPPVWDGIAAANGQLFLATSDGSVCCLSGR